MLRSKEKQEIKLTDQSRLADPGGLVNCADVDAFPRLCGARVGVVVDHFDPLDLHVGPGVGRHIAAPAAAVAPAVKDDKGRVPGRLERDGRHELPVDVPRARPGRPVEAVVGPVAPAPARGQGSIARRLGDGAGAAPGGLVGVLDVSWWVEGADLEVCLLHEG